MKFKNSKNYSTIILVILTITTQIFSQDPFSAPTVLPGTDANMSQAVAFGDYNNDGYLDVFVDNDNITFFGPQKGNNSFYANDGDGTFTRKGEADIGNIVYEGSGNSPYRTFGSGFAWTDFNNDGYMDVFNCSGGGKDNILWQNNPSTGQFDDVTHGVMQPVQTSFISVSWVDFDNDGDMDLFACNMIDGNVWHNYLFQNNTTFTTVSFDVNLNDENPKIERFEGENDIDKYRLYNIIINNNYCASVVNIGQTKFLRNYFVKSLFQI